MMCSPFTRLTTWTAEFPPTCEHSRREWRITQTGDSPPRLYLYERLRWKIKTTERPVHQATDEGWCAAITAAMEDLRR